MESAAPDILSLAAYTPSVEIKAPYATGLP